MTTTRSPEAAAVLKACGATSFPSGLNLIIASIASKAIRAAVDQAGDWECADRLLDIATEIDPKL